MAALQTALAVCLLVSSAICKSSAIKYAELEDDSRPEFWLKNGQSSLKRALGLDQNTNKAKNVIVFLGDGMGIPTITASRIYKGQKNKRRGEETVLTFEEFPNVALIKTYNVDRQVPDSAATATAIFSGVKTNYETLGVSPKAQRSNCLQSKPFHIDSVLNWAQQSGRSTGIVTTTRITHATPGSLYAHVAHRDWENDSVKPPNATECKDIARQLIEDEPGRNVDVIFGGGRRNFLDKTEGGDRADGMNLIEMWKKTNNSSRRRYVNTRQEMADVKLEDTDQIMGLFALSHMDYELDRSQSEEVQPSLKEMTEMAINILKKNSNGFFLLVEGGRIDHAHHDNQAKRSFEDTVAFEEAIRRTRELTKSDDTLIVVTADHSHVMTINGYPERGNDILGFGDVSDMDHHPYTTIMYTTGPGFVDNVTMQRSKLEASKTSDDSYLQMALVPTKYETHGGEDVAAYALGPYAHLFQGVQEQNYIAHVINFAACMGPKEFIKQCDLPTTDDATITRPSFIALVTSLLLLCVTKFK